MDIIEKCIDLIKSNRISSTEVADALGKNGVIHLFSPINSGKFAVGEVHYLFGHSASNWPIHEQAVSLPEGKLVYVDAFDCDEKALFGDLVSKYLLLYKKSKGLVINGLMRDIPDLKHYNFPIWCKGVSPLGCYNKNIEPSKDIIEASERNRQLFQGGIMVCDDSGCTLIQKELINEELYTKLEMIELQEDIWSYCINTLKWSTYDTVCLKRYLSEPEVLPVALQEKVKNIPFKS